MKKNLFTLILLCGAFAACAQSSTGLIAHWDMDGTVNDISGNGNNGTASNLTPATGRDGFPGSAYYFNGVNSCVTVPYSSAFNLNNYSICATVKVMGFYSGTSQGNIIITRGSSPRGIPGAWGLIFTDNCYDDNDGTAFDSTQDVFCGIAGPLAPASITTRYYTPTIVEDVWYSIVVTFNDTAYKTYVNDTLRNTTLITTPGASMGTSTDSISIGYDIMDALSGYPDQFKGIIDDIRVYNRVLADTEVTTYYTTAVPVINNEPLATIYPNPAHNELTVQNGAHNALKIYNVLGQEIYAASLTNKTQSLDISNLANGIFFVQLTGIDGNKRCMQLLKQ